MGSCRGSFRRKPRNAITICIFLVFVSVKVASISGNEEEVVELERRSRSRVRNVINGCDIFDGKWVYDESYPLYDTRRCSFIGSGFDCQKNGRPDKNYLKYRWQPQHCHLQRFNGRVLLERWKGKKIMFVGDSLSFNQWESLTCMLHNAVPNSRYTLVNRGSLSVFSIPEYKVSIMMLKNGFLVDVVTEKVGRVLKLDSISTGSRWLGVDVLIFNSYHWWTHRWEYFQVGGRLMKDLDHMEAYKIAMKTWAKWVDTNIDNSNTQVFFQGVSAAHLNGSEWREPKAKYCLRQSGPIQESRYVRVAHPGEAIVKRVLSQMERHVHLLDITYLSQLRKDGHPSIYAGGGPKLLDCSHWCLAGVPDTWNQLLYSILIGQ